MIKKIRNFERFVNDLPTDWKIGIAFGILFGCIAMERILRMLGGG